jgi:endoglucanase
LQSGSKRQLNLDVHIIILHYDLTKGSNSMKRVAPIVIVLLISVQLFAANNDYTALHNLLIKFYGYERAGLATGTGSCYNLSSALPDGSHNGDNYNGSPLDGGWYDAGDYIKFGMNLSYATYCLLKGYDVFPSGYANNYDSTYKGTDNIPDILNEVKVATNYIMKAVINENTIIYDVGIAATEHQDLGVANNPAGRSASQISLCTGADIPMTYVACLALMSTVYRKYDAAYADNCLAKAKIAFAFAEKKYNAGGDANLYCTPQKKDGAALYDYPKTNNAYKLDRISDRVVAAGVELYRASTDADPNYNTYKTWAKKSISGEYNCMGYSYIGPLASFEVWRQGLSSGADALTANIGFLETKVNTTSSSIFYNIYQNTDWGTARDAGSAAFEYALAYVTTPDATSRTLYEKRIRDHIDWISGLNGKQSYICGFGSNAPQNAHFRTTSWKAVPGGVVTGPNAAGTWMDSKEAQYGEVAIDYNAGIIGAIAFVKALTDPGDCVKVTTAFSANPGANIDLSTKGATFSAVFSASVAWTIKITGANGSKTLTGTGATISAIWDGTADKGMFLGGEKIIASLTVDRAIVAYDILKVNPLSIYVSKVKKDPAKTTDILVDNFDDKDMKNQVNGNWLAFGSESGIWGPTVSCVTDSGSAALSMAGSVTSASNKTYAGAKATFSADNSPVSIGNVTSVLFDIRGSKATNVYVELEQSTITDGAYWSVVVPITTISNRYRVNVADFKQTSWKTSEKPLDLTNISALRFAVYDSTSSITLFLDNVYIENLQTGVVRAVSRSIHSSLKPIVTRGELLYSIPQDAKGILDVAVYNMGGKEVMKQSLNVNSAKTISISLSNLPAGMYTVCNSINGTVVGKKLKFVHAK